MSEKYSPDDVNVADVDEKRITQYDSSPSLSDSWLPPEEWLERLVEEYSGQHGGESETFPAGADPNRTANAIFTFNEEQSVKILESLIQDHQTDYTIDHNLLNRCRELIQGHTACGMEEGEWAYVTCKTAGLVNNWSPYAEVRAVTLPYDDPDEPCESIRAYLVGFFWVCVASAVNTCKFFLVFIEF
jgi:hypothetical protein